MNIPPASAPPAPQLPADPPSPAMEEADAFAEMLKRRKAMGRDAPQSMAKRATIDAEALHHPLPRHGEPALSRQTYRHPHDRELLHDASPELGLALPQQVPGAPMTVTVPAAPQPHVDPSGFAELMTRLWLRAQAQKSREVRVQFGNDAWPATGARLIRAADGALDIAVLVADRGAEAIDAALGELHAQLETRGLAVGALDVERG